jgi:hypothetical protein
MMTDNFLLLPVHFQCTCTTIMLFSVMFVLCHIGFITSKTMEVVNVDWDKSFIYKIWSTYEQKGKRIDSNKYSDQHKEYITCK